MTRLNKGKKSRHLSPQHHSPKSTVLTTEQAERLDYSLIRERTPLTAKQIEERAVRHLERLEIERTHALRAYDEGDDASYADIVRASEEIEEFRNR